MKISGKTAVYGVIGDPVEHSLSPAMQNAAFEDWELDCAFLAFKVSSNEVERVFSGIRGLNIRGLNVTMPLKSAVITYLDEIDENARFLDSVNTILNSGGTLRGFSTDGVGAHRALEENIGGFSGKKLVILGAGGSAKAIAFALAKEASELVLLNRTLGKTAMLVKTIKQKFHKEIVVDLLSPSSVEKNLRDADVLINATSVGMRPHAEESLVKPALLNSRLTVMDIVYNPLETRLARDAKAAGARVISGLEMLVYQGAASFEIWTGKPAPVEVMRRAALNQLKPVGDGNGRGKS